MPLNTVPKCIITGNIVVQRMRARATRPYNRLWHKIMEPKRYNPEIHHRRSIRIKEYDYSQEGLYFITICTFNHESLFGHIDNGDMVLSEYGEIINNEWLQTGEMRRNITLHEFVIMPNHMHGIIEINDSTRRGTMHRALVLKELFSFLIFS